MPTILRGAPWATLSSLGPSAVNEATTVAAVVCGWRLDQRDGEIRVPGNIRGRGPFVSRGSRGRVGFSGFLQWRRVMAWCTRARIVWADEHVGDREASKGDQ